jgi:hypothetical protein
MRPKLRIEWRESVAKWRAELGRLFAARSIRPFHVTREFDGDAMSSYFFEAGA